MITIPIKLTIDQKHAMSAIVRRMLGSKECVQTSRDAFMIDCTYSVLEKLLQRQLNDSKIRFTLMEMAIMENVIYTYGMIGIYEENCARTLLNNVAKKLDHTYGIINENLMKINNS